MVNFDHIAHVKISILNQPLQKDERKDIILPNPHRLLSSEVPLGAIEL